MEDIQPHAVGDVQVDLQRKPAADGGDENLPHANPHIGRGGNAQQPAVVAGNTVHQGTGHHGRAQAQKGTCHVQQRIPANVQPIAADIFCHPQPLGKQLF